nr:hypothetical protein [Nocardioides aquaticus]
MTPSLRHQLLATLVPRLRGAGDLDVSSGVAAAATVERDRVSRRQEGLDRSLPTGLVPGLGRQWVARRELLAGTDGEFPAWALEPRTGEATSTVYHLHGAGSCRRPTPRTCGGPPGSPVRWGRGWCCRTTRWRPRTTGGPPARPSSRTSRGTPSSGGWS